MNGAPSPDPNEMRKARQHGDPGNEAVVWSCGDSRQRRASSAVLIRRGEESKRVGTLFKVDSGDLGKVGGLLGICAQGQEKTKRKQQCIGLNARGGSIERYEEMADGNLSSGALFVGEQELGSG